MQLGLSSELFAHAVRAVEISEPGNVEYTRMSLEALAVVFTPSVIRSPGEDFLEVLLVV